MNNQYSTCSSKNNSCIKTGNTSRLPVVGNVKERVIDVHLAKWHALCSLPP